MRHAQPACSRVSSVTLIAVICLFVVLSGCLQQRSGYSQSYTDGLSSVAIYNSSYFHECELGTCWCMMCKNGTYLFGSMKNLIGGYCFWDKNCNVTRFADLNNRTLYPNVTSRSVMIGQGPTFSDFAIGNQYCGQQLGMAVQWLPAIGQSDYIEPDPMRAMCMLSKDVIPVYMLYSGGANVDPDQAQKIARILGTEGKDFFMGKLSDGPVGPVIIVMEPDASAGNAPQIADAIRRMDMECNPDRDKVNDAGNVSCMLAVAPKFNDYEGMKALMDQPGMKESVDFIAYGINGSSAHGCDSAAILDQALNFSRYALYDLGKPTIIPYVLFDVGTHDADNTCDWTESSVAAAYGAFLPTGMNRLKARGVAGIAAYSFNISSSMPVVNPLNCSDCGVGRTAARMNVWYGGCQAYAVKKNASGAVLPRGKSAIMFSNASGGSCLHGDNQEYLTGLAFRNKDIRQPQLTSAPDKINKSFTCDACLVRNSTRSVMSMFRFDLEPAPNPTASDCTAYDDLISMWAGARSLDPTLVRAIMLTESGRTPSGELDPCSAARSCRPDHTDNILPSCFPTGEGYKKGYTRMFDPTGTCDKGLPNPPSTTGDPEWRWLGLGLMQALVPPYTYWPASVSPTGEPGENYPYYQDAVDRHIGVSSLEVAKSCKPNFNPFDPGDSICVGTAVFKDKLADAHEWLQNHHDYFNWPTSDEDKDRVFETYIALHKYGGFWDSNLRVRTVNGVTAASAWPGCSSSLNDSDCWAQAFKESWQITTKWCAENDEDSDPDYDVKCKDGEPRGKATGEAPAYCYGYTDFVEYFHYCQRPFLTRQTDPGAKKLHMYNNILTSSLDECKNNVFCPEGTTFLAKLLKGSGKSPPASGDPYLPDSVMKED
ncbi:hypothetical protein H0O00_00905 [Candidatus Micrarchaeota archaeon]|nr:hypothetical protein [Candidatus Micrarchaeota archaeon]